MPGEALEIDGYRPGALGRVVALHADYYSREWGLGLDFESTVAAGLAEFLRRRDPARDGFWTAWRGGELLGSITVDGSRDDPNGPRLRFFITSDAARGTGVGRRLMQEAMDFARQADLPSVYLWTFEGLAPAIHLYEVFGFQKVKAHVDEQWGEPLHELMYRWTP